jgi:transposase
MPPANGSWSPFLAACKARGWIKGRGTQRTDATHVLAAMRTLHRVACVLAAMPWALHQRSAAAPAWVQQQRPLEWSPCDGLRSNPARLPKDASTRAALARQIGADGSQLSAQVQTADPSRGWRELPALEALRQIWLQQDDRWTVPGLEALCWRTGDEPLPAAVRLASPYDLEACDRSTRETHRVGDKVHLTDTCDADHPIS